MKTINYVDITQDGNIFNVKLQILDGESVVLEAETNVVKPMKDVPEGSTQETEVKSFIENVFLADLRNMDDTLSDLVLPFDPVIPE
jgi:hypothetical protein